MWSVLLAKRLDQTGDRMGELSRCRLEAGNLVVEELEIGL
jgi:hypothetical protein